MTHRRSYSQFLQKPSLTIKPSEIPMELAQKIIEKEIELDKFMNLQTIHDLISLYSKAMEHYEQQESPKYLDFQERMHKMLIQPQVLSLLKRKNCTSASEETLPLAPNEEINPSPVLQYGNDELSLRKQQAEYTRRELSSQLNKSLFKHQAKRNFTMIIDRHKEFSKDIASRAAADVKSQESALEKRIAFRRNRQNSKSLILNTSDTGPNMFTCDFSDIFEEQNTSTKSSLFTIEEYNKEGYDSFENKLEEIMEKNFGERAGKVAEVRAKYQCQINEYSGMGEFMSIIVEQMKKNMQEEINAIMSEYDLKRKREISRLKEELYN